MKNLLAFLVLVFCCGIFFAAFIKISFCLVYSLSIVLLILSFQFIMRIKIFNVLVLTLIFILGGVSLKNTQSLPLSHISHFFFYSNDDPYLLKGTIANEPSFENHKTSFIFNIKEIQITNSAYRSCGKILVHIKGIENLRYGEELILKGNLHRPFSKSPEGKSYKNYLSNQGIFFIMQVKDTADIARLNINKGSEIKRFSFWLKNKIEDRIYKNVSLSTAGILDAMVLGEKKNISPNIIDSMIKLGTVHILVVSGFNVGIVAFVTLLFLKLLRLKKKIRIFIAISCLIVYSLMTGASNPVVRATIMAIVFLLAYLKKREPDIYNSLGLAALFILISNPKQLFDVGFQLSFASVISIVFLYPKLKVFLRAALVKNKSLKFLMESLLVSLSAWLGTMGFIAYYFKIFSPAAVLANIFVVPLSTLITLCGFSLIFISLILPPATPFFALTLELACSLLIKANIFLASFPFASFRLP